MTVKLKNSIRIFLLLAAFSCGQISVCFGAETLPEAEAASETSPALKTEADSKAESASNVEAASEAKAAPDIDNASQTEPAMKSEAASKSESAPQMDSEYAESQSELIDVESQTASELSESDTEDSSETAEPATNEALETLISQIRGSLPAGNGSWAVYINDLVSGAESSIDSRRMQAASLIKLYIMGAVYENYESLSSRYGQDSLDSYLYSMITVSDNDSANALTNCLGGGDPAAGMAIVNEYCMEHGYYETHMGRLLLHSNEFDDNYTSVSDCGHFLQTVYNGDPEECPHVDSMYSLLKAQQRRNKIPAQMPAEVHVANKTGELDDVENDAGILYDTGNDLIIVFMSENLSDVGSAQSAIASLSRQIYDYYAISCN